jgi:hypothetical protein
VRYTFVGEGLSFIGELFVGAGFVCGARSWVGEFLGAGLSFVGAVVPRRVSCGHR